MLVCAIFNSSPEFKTSPYMHAITHIWHWGSARLMASKFGFFHHTRPSNKSERSIPCRGRRTTTIDETGSLCILATKNKLRRGEFDFMVNPFQMASIITHQTSSSGGDLSSISIAYHLYSHSNMR